MSSDTDAIIVAVGRTMRAELAKLTHRLEYADLRASKLEERLQNAVERIDELEKLAEANEPVLRHVQPSGHVKLIKAV